MALTAEQSQTDKFSISLLLGIRILRSAAAGLVNFVFPFFILTELHYSYLLLGLIYTAATLATAGIGLLVGFATDFSRKPAFIFALALLPISTILIFFSQNLFIIFVAAMLGGYSATGSLAGGGVGGSVQPAQSTVISDATSRKDRSFYYAIMSFTAGISAAIGALLGGYIPTHELFLVATALGIISVIPAGFIRVRKAERRRIRQLGIKSRQVIGKFSAVGLLNGLSNGLVAPFMIPFFIAVYGITKSQMNVYVAAAGIIGSCSFLFGPKIEHALGFVKGVVVTRGATIILMVVFALVRIFPLSIIIYLAFPAFKVAAFPVIQTAMMDMVSEEERGRLFGINQASRLTMSSVGASFAGYEFEISEIPIPFLSYALVLGTNMFLYARFFMNYRDPLRQRRPSADG